ncbi:tRNA (cytidine(34)-2'-O)-methyltransferase [Sphingomonas sp.]|uniref:tRNA (cytidine(34)-2'-O)-methyltransferase n=1 Tax=Sphingomonas sp. TaxID=28214 RepID=UPI002DBC1809|nr:tRNA (cytidine(34)-2'-O)-methyltransferase [Sphingomonas sp.]HEU4968203.1 tRNA (cytidine(34)-2'-O)-methyltransferase [Sphingomonas sp.]
MRLALFQPDIPGNVGAILRSCACFGVPVDLIEPLGFPWDDKRVRRAGMDYYDHVSITRHADWDAFRAATPGRLVLLTARGSVPLTEAAFEPGDVILMGSESAGAPAHVHAAAELRIRIPMAPDLRSLNVSVAAAVTVYEALRQLGQLPT